MKNQLLTNKVVRVKDLANYYGVCRRTAAKKSQEIKQNLGLSQNQSITMAHVLKYDKISAKEVLSMQN